MVSVTAEAHALGYTGPALTAAQRDEALAFLDWIRHRDESPHHRPVVR